jgi:hypothetical protein
MSSVDGGGRPCASRRSYLPRGNGEWGSGGMGEWGNGKMEEWGMGGRTRKAAKHARRQEEGMRGSGSSGKAARAAAGQTGAAGRALCNNGVGQGRRSLLSRLFLSLRLNRRAPAPRHPPHEIPAPGQNLALQVLRSSASLLVCTPRGNTVSYAEIHHVRLHAHSSTHSVAPRRARCGGALGWACGVEVEFRCLWQQRLDGALS